VNKTGQNKVECNNLIKKGRVGEDNRHIQIVGLYEGGGDLPIEAKVILTNFTIRKNGSRKGCPRSEKKETRAQGGSGGTGTESKRMGEGGG